MAPFARQGMCTIVYQYSLMHSHCPRPNPAQGFLEVGTDIRPIVPALEKIWADSLGRSLSDFNFRTVTSKFNELVYQYPIHIPERYALVIR
jgi:predicted unusual protein kinase regulating ubiquinone biosynthesis (AarF/ABC1/UbiB family)